MRLFLNDRITAASRKFKLNLRTGWLLVALGALALCAPFVVLRAQDAKAPATTPNRFLLIFDVSGPVHRRFEHVEKAAQQILESRCNGQMHFGDSLGVWTFDHKLHTGDYPLEIWQAGGEDATQRRLLEFLKSQRAARTSRLAEVLAGIAQVIQGPQITTVILFSTADNPMQGTPFDQEINQVYREAAKEMKHEPMPVVTVLQARDGRFLKYSVNALPWPVVIPELPIPIKFVARHAETPVVPTPAAPAQGQAPANTSPPATATPTPPTVAAAQPATSVPPATPPPDTTQPPATAPAATTPSMTAPPGPAPVVRPQTASSAPAHRLALNPPSNPMATAPIQRPPQPMIPPLATNNATAVPRTAAAPPPPNMPKPGPGHPGNASGAPAVAKTTPPGVRLPGASGSATDEKTSSVVKAAPKTNAPPVEGAMAIATPGNRSRMLLLAGLAVVLVALLLLVMTLRRPRDPGKISLISQSMNDYDLKK